VSVVIQTLAAVVGTVGFCLSIRLRPSRFWVVSICAALCYLMYVLAKSLGAGEFAANFVAVLLLTLAAEILAIVLKAPLTVFLIPPILPLIPGAHLYYFIEGIFKGDLAQGVSHFVTLMSAIGGIVLGITIISAIFSTVRKNRPCPLPPEIENTTK